MLSVCKGNVHMRSLQVLSLSFSLIVSTLLPFYLCNFRAVMVFLEREVHRETLENQ